MLSPSKIDEGDDDNDIEVTPGIVNKPTTMYPPIQTTPTNSGTSAEIMKPVADENNSIMTVDNEQYKVVCYFTNWAWYR